MSYRRLGLLLALPMVVGISLSACGTEDDAAPGPDPTGGSGPTGGTAGAGDSGGGAGKGGTGAEAGMDAQGGMAGESGPGGAGGSAGDGLGGAAGDGLGGAAGDGNIAGAGGEGGALPPVPTCTGPVELVNFNTDPGGAMGKYLTPATGPVQQSVVSWSAPEENQGVSAPGAGKLIATFGAYSEQAQLSLYFNHAHWLCQTKLRAKVKLISATDLSHINGIGFGINSGNSTTGARYSQQFTSTTTWAMDTWYTIELPFATAGYKDPAGTLPDFNDVVGVGVQVQSKSTGTLPVETTLYVDDVWLE